METRLFDYELPEDRIAQRPAEERDGARLLVLGPAGTRHARFRDWSELVPAGALVVLNDTRVLRARILAARAGSGGKVEVLLVRKMGELGGGAEEWLAIGRANRPLRAGTRAAAGPLSIEVVALGEDSLTVRLEAESGVEAAIEAVGRVPLPPYVRRLDEPGDVERYQTVFAREGGSVAAPTAGLHISRSTLERLRARGVQVGFVTLHVGLGTFRPVSAPDLDGHTMHAEEFAVSEELADAVVSARAREAPVVAVGTTVVRALESAADRGDPRRVQSFAGETRLLIQPGFRFGPVDALLTNFHAPRSTLLALVAAFAGRERVLSAYADALSEGYRFLSYGDAMWIPERGP